MIYILITLFILIAGLIMTIPESSGLIKQSFKDFKEPRIVYTYIFYVGAENIVKIGFSNNVERRKKQLENRYNIYIDIIKIYPINIEKDLHLLLKSEYLDENNIITNDWLGSDFKYGTEWFTFSEQIKKLVKS